MPSHLLGLHRQRSDAWPHAFRGGLRPGTHDLGAHERDSPDWQEPSLYQDTGCLRHLASSNGLGSQLRHATRFPLHHGLHRLPSSGNRRCKYRGYSQATKARIRHRALGDISGLRTGSGAFDWRLCCSCRSKRVDVDDMGAYLAFGVLPRGCSLLSPGDFELEYPILTREAAQEAYRPRQSQDRRRDHGRVDGASRRASNPWCSSSTSALP